MQRVIDIPDSDYQRIKEYYEKNDVVEATYSYIYHGTPFNEVLDKIRAEIEDEGAMFPDGEFFVSIYRINEIIDKYRKEQE